MTHMHEHDHEHDHGHEYGTDKYTQLIGRYAVCKLTAEAVDKALEDIRRDVLPQVSGKKKVLRKLFGCMDLTSLGERDTEEGIIDMVTKAAHIGERYEDLSAPAAVCVYPAFVRAAKDAADGQMKVATVPLSSFPTAQTYAEVKIAEVGMAVMEGADEIDVVFPMHHFLSGKYDKVEEEIMEMKASCRGGKLKVILETGRMESPAEVAKAAVLSLASGADFIKTSTGKTAVGATPEAVYVMSKAIEEYNRKTGERAGLKVSGGIATVDDALGLYAVAAGVLGEAYLTAETFRIGASRLAGALVEAVEGERYF